MVPLLTRIENFQNFQLTGIRPDYVDLLPSNINNINWQNIFNSFLTLTNDIDIFQERPLGSLAQALGQVIFVTAEAMRFPDIYARIVTHLIQRDENINLQRDQINEIYRILVSWGTRSRDEVLQESLRQAINNVNNPNWNRFSMVDLTRQLNSPAIQILLGYIEFERIRNNGRNANCRRGKRDITNKFWHEKFCDLKPQIDKIQGKITAIKFLENDSTENQWVKKGHMFLGTNNGFYTINENGEVSKRMTSINYVKNIIINDDNNAYITNKECEIYDLKFKEWSYEKTNMESCDLNKELKLYYNNDKSDKFAINYDWSQTMVVLKLFKTFNVLNRDPLDNYEKIEFLGSHHNFKQTRTSWGDEAYWPKNILSDFNSKYYTKKYITNLGKLENNLNWKTPPPLYWTVLQDFHEKWAGATIEGSQKFALNYYREFKDGNFYLQFITWQYATCWASSISGGQTMGVGNGIRLYNDDENIRTKREIFDINNLEDKADKRFISNELKNITKWTDDFTKSINHEQHLPINNKTNFVTNNITSL